MGLHCNNTTGSDPTPVPAIRPSFDLFWYNDSTYQSIDAISVSLVFSDGKVIKDTATNTACRISLNYLPRAIPTTIKVSALHAGTLVFQDSIASVSFTENKFYYCVLKDHALSAVQSHFDFYSPVDSLYAIGYIYFENSFYRPAMPYFQTILSTCPTDLLAGNSCYHQGRCYFSLKLYREAITTFLRLFQQYPSNQYRAPAKYFTGRSFYELGIYDSAVIFLDTVASLDSANQKTMDALYYSGISSYYQKKYTEANSYFTPLIRKFPTDTLYRGNAFYYSGLSLFYIDSCDSAIGRLNRFCDSFPGNSNIIFAPYYIGKAYFNLNQDLKALPYFVMIIATAPPPDSVYKANAYYLAGLCEFTLGKYESALSYLKPFISLFPANAGVPYALYYAGKSCYDLNRHTEAISYFAGVIINPPSPDSIYKADAYYFTGNSDMILATDSIHPDSALYDTAIANYTLLLSTFPGSINCSNAQQKTGQAYFAENNLVQAKACLIKVEQIYPGTYAVAPALYYLGRVYMAQKYYDSALTVFNHYAALFPDSMDYADNVQFESGKCLYDKKDYSKAVDQFTLTTQRFPGSSVCVNAYYYCIQSHIKWGIPAHCDGAKSALLEMESQFPLPNVTTQKAQTLYNEQNCP
jgi:tetratricopeptide (TPR) repeat protein